MAGPQDEGVAASEPARPVGTVRNRGEPLRFASVEPLAGVTAEPAQGGQMIKVWTRLALT